MSVVRRGRAVVVVSVVALAALGGTASAQEGDPTLAPDDPSISETGVAPEPSDTETVVLEDGSGCEVDPVICQSAVAPTSDGGGAQLPRTGPHDGLLATGALGAGLLLAGAGAVVAGRRRAA